MLAIGIDLIEVSRIETSIMQYGARFLKRVFTENELAVVLCDHKDAQILLDLKFDHIFFTGSTSVGKMVMESAAKNLTPVTLELGGKSPAIIDGTYNIEKTAKRISWGKFINAGQTCIAPDYLLVKEGIEEEIIQSMIKHITNFYEAGDGFYESKIYPRLISEQHTDKLEKLIESEIASGSKISFGGKVNQGEKCSSILGGLGAATGTRSGSVASTLPEQGNEKAGAPRLGAAARQRETISGLRAWPLRRRRRRAARRRGLRRA